MAREEPEMHTPPREHHIGRVATRAAGRWLRRDRFQELIGQTRRQLQRELGELDSRLETARIERAAAEHRYRHQVAIVDSRRAEIRRRLASL